MPFQAKDNVLIVARDDTGEVKGPVAGTPEHYDVHEDASKQTNPHHEGGLNKLPCSTTRVSEYYTKKVEAYVANNHRVIEVTVYRGGTGRPRGGRWFRQIRKSKQ